MTDRIEQLARRIDPEAFDVSRYPVLNTDGMEQWMRLMTLDDYTKRMAAVVARKNEAFFAAKVAIGVNLILNPIDDGK